MQRRPRYRAPAHECLQPRSGLPPLLHRSSSCPRRTAAPALARPHGPGPVLWTRQSPPLTQRSRRESKARSGRVVAGGSSSTGGCWRSQKRPSDATRAVPDGSHRTGHRDGGAGDRVDVVTELERIAHVLALELGGKGRQVDGKVAVGFVVIT